MRPPCWCSKQWQNIAHVLHNNSMKFPKDLFSLLFSTQTWPPWRHMKAENTKNGSVDSFMRQNRQQMRVCVTVEAFPSGNKRLWKTIFNHGVVFCIELAGICAGINVLTQTMPFNATRRKKPTKSWRFLLWLLSSSHSSCFPITSSFCGLTLITEVSELNRSNARHEAYNPVVAFGDQWAWTSERAFIHSHDAIFLDNATQDFPLLRMYFVPRVGRQDKYLVLSNELIKVELPPWKI